MLLTVDMRGNTMITLTELSEAFTNNIVVILVQILVKSLKGSKIFQLQIIIFKERTLKQLPIRPDVAVTDSRPQCATRNLQKQQNLLLWAAAASCYCWYESTWKHKVWTEVYHRERRPRPGFLKKGFFGQMSLKLKNRKTEMKVSLTHYEVDNEPMSIPPL